MNKTNRELYGAVDVTVPLYPVVSTERSGTCSSMGGVYDYKRPAKLRGGIQPSLEEIIVNRRQLGLCEQCYDIFDPQEVKQYDRQQERWQMTDPDSEERGELCSCKMLKPHLMCSAKCKAKHDADREAGIEPPEIPWNIRNSMLKREARQLGALLIDAMDKPQRMMKEERRFITADMQKLLTKDEFRKWRRLGDPNTPRAEREEEVSYQVRQLLL